MPEITALTPQAKLWDRLLRVAGIVVALVGLCLVAWTSRGLDPTDTSFWAVALTAAGMIILAAFFMLFSVYMEDWE